MVGKPILIIVIMIAVVQSAVYIAVVPPWGAPDEPQHFAYIRHLWSGSPKQGTEAIEKEILASMDRHDWYRQNGYDRPQKPPQRLRDVPFFSVNGIPIGYHPAPYYQINSYALQSLVHLSLEEQLYFARGLSAIMGMIVVMLAFLTARTAFPNDPGIVMTVSAFVVLLPQRAFISGTVNNDNLAVLVASLAFFLSVSLFVRPQAGRNLLLLLSTCALLPGSKGTALTVLPAAIVGLLTAALAFLKRSLSVRHARMLGLVATLTFMAVVAGVVVSAIIKPQTMVLWGSPVRYAGPLQGLSYILDGAHYQPQHLEAYGRSLSVLTESFWARFGWMQVMLPSVWASIVSALTMLSLVGAARFIIAHRSDSAGSVSDVAVFTVLVSGIVVLIGFGAAFLVRLTPVLSGLPQGRYALPVLIPFAIVFCVGLRSLLPRRFHPWFPPLLLSFMFLLNIVSVLLMIVPFHYR